mmetsp:Transcript_6174/g.12689  ORF Transcript_6174/g.12689 Transcript_6174/m.12689 type:complete len:199 (+) Transcript_6174:111-707(+)
MTDNTPLLDPADVTGVTQGNENQYEEGNTNNNNNNEQQDEEEEDSTTPVPRWYKCFVLAVVLAVTATVLRFVPPTMATAVVIFQAMFELVSAFVFIVDPSQLHNGWMPDEGMPTYLAEAGGINYAFWGALLVLKHRDVTILWLNTVYCAVWVVYLGTHWLDMPWRDAVQLHDGSWAKVPVMVKGICGVASVVAAVQLK